MPLSTTVPVVSVVLNSYNQASHLADAIESVLSQTFEAWELLLVDNGSTDDSPEIARRYAGDTRVRLLLEPTNEPVGRRFNQAVGAARGEFVSFLYSDDFYLPHKLELQVELLRASGNEVGVAYGPATVLHQPTGRRWVQGSIGRSGEVLRDLLRRYRRGQIDMVSPLTRRACLLAEPFYEDMFAEGEAIFLRLAVGTRFVHHEQSVAVLRDHSDNAGKALRRNCEMTMTSIDRLGAHPSFPASHAADLRWYRRSLLRSYGWQAVRLGGDRRWARARFVDALRVSALEALNPRTVGGLILASVPGRVHRRATAVLDVGRRRGGREAVLVDDYEGLG